MWFKYGLKAQKLIAQGNGHKQHALKGRVFKIRLKFGTFFSRIIGLTN